MSENRVKRDIENAAADAGGVSIDRTNAGMFYQGQKVRLTRAKALELVGQEVLTRLRIVKGLPEDYPDYAGDRLVTITQEMVGRRIAQSVKLEAKDEKGPIRPGQARHIAIARARGACAAIVRSGDEALAVLTAPAELPLATDPPFPAKG